MEEEKMKNTTRAGYITIEGGFEGENIVRLSIDVPQHIFNDFTHCFDDGNEKGAKTLEDLYDLYTSLSKKQKEIFQLSIYENSHKINSTENLVEMLKCLKIALRDLDC